MKHRISVICCAIALVGCAENPETNAAVHDAQSLASLQDIMATVVDPAADALWASVESTTTADSSVDKQPLTAADWAIVRRHAVALVEAGNLLAHTGRPVAREGRVIEDAHIEGVLTAHEIQSLILANPSAFVRHVQDFQSASQEALSAIDARDPSALFDAGGKLQQACEQCHRTYWYPNAKRPGFPGLSSEK